MLAPRRSRTVSFRVWQRVLDAHEYMMRNDRRYFKSLSDWFAVVAEEIARRKAPQFFEPEEESGLQSPHALGSGPALGPEPTRRPRPGRLLRFAAVIGLASAARPTRPAPPLPGQAPEHTSTLHSAGWLRSFRRRAGTGAGEAIPTAARRPSAWLPSFHPVFGMAS